MLICSDTSLANPPQRLTTASFHAVRAMYFLVPAPRFDNYDTLNGWLEEKCLKRQDDIVRGHSETIGERLMRDLDSLMALPPVPYDACK